MFVPTREVARCGAAEWEYLYMSQASGSSQDRLSTAQLLALAQESEPGVTERMLELWRHQDLLPKAERTGQDGTRPVWTYPTQAAAQLGALLRLRAATKDPNLLRPALWFDGYRVPTSRVRESMLAVLRKIQAEVDKELARRSAARGQDPEHGRSQALAEIARDLASRRGTGLPRHGRQRLDDRTRGFETMFRLGLGEEPSPSQLDDHASAAVERVMGVDQARRYRPGGIPPWLTGPPAEGLAVFQEIGSLPRLLEALDSADEAELEQARPFVRTLLTGLAAFSQIADAFAGYRNASGLAAAEALKDEPMIRIMATAMVISAMRIQELAANIQDVNATLTTTILPVEADARKIATMPEAEREARISKLTWPEQRRIRRLISKFDKPWE
jgi:hypothetical protein